MSSCFGLFAHGLHERLYAVFGEVQFDALPVVGEEDAGAVSGVDFIYVVFVDEVSPVSPAECAVVEPSFQGDEAFEYHHLVV